MKRTELQKELDGNIPTEAISTREQAGKTLSYLETWYVIDLLNQIIGQGNWGYRIVDLNKVFEGTVAQYSGDVFSVSYVSQVSLTATIDGVTTLFTEVGYGDGTDKKSPGKAHELATKGAVSDALKRAAKNLGRKMGLALYDKTKEYVGEAKDTTNGTQTTIKTADETIASENTNNSPGKSTTRTVEGNEPGVPGTTQTNRPTRKLIQEAFKILEVQKKTTKDGFKETYLGGVGLSKLEESALESVLSKVKTDFPELGL